MRAGFRWTAQSWGGRWAAVVLQLLSVVASSESRAERALPIIVEANDQQALQERLLAISELQLQPLGLHIDLRRVWLTLSAPLPAGRPFEVRPVSLMGNSAPRLPLTFELRAVDAQASTIRATLAVSLQREVWLASRRLRKGSKVACADFSLERRDIRAVPQSALPVSCELGADVVALHDIAARDVVQSVDFGAAPDVAAGAPVRVSVVNGPISVSTTAIALADAKVGDQIPVRLNRPVRTLKGRVTAPGAVQLGDSAP